MTHKIYLLLGGNTGNRQLYLSEGIKAIEADCGRILARSAVYETAAWGKEDQQPFLNMAVELTSRHSPESLLESIAAIEHRLGRQRDEPWGARTLDIDILFYDDAVIQTPRLTIPHPLLQERRFVLAPLADIAPGIVHPVFQKTIAELLKDCSDSLPVQVLP